MFKEFTHVFDEGYCIIKLNSIYLLNILKM